MLRPPTLPSLRHTSRPEACQSVRLAAANPSRLARWIYRPPRRGGKTTSAKLRPGIVSPTGVNLARPSLAPFAEAQWMGIRVQAAKRGYRELSGGLRAPWQFGRKRYAFGEWRHGFALFAPAGSSKAIATRSFRRKPALMLGGV